MRKLPFWKIKQADYGTEKSQDLKAESVWLGRASFMVCMLPWKALPAFVANIKYLPNQSPIGERLG